MRCGWVWVQPFWKDVFKEIRCVAPVYCAEKDDFFFISVFQKQAENGENIFFSLLKSVIKQTFH